MKKLHIAIALVLWGFAQSATAQNMYRNYLSTAVPSPESAVSVVHSNGYVYFFQTNYTSQTLSIAELDPLSLLPTGNNRSIQYNIQFMANGVFEDFNGNFVLFGYDRNNSTWNWHPAILVIDPNFSNSDMYNPNNQNIVIGSFTAGCSGYDINGDEIYVFVGLDGKLYAVNTMSPTLFREFTANPNLPFFDKYADISWDQYHNMFVASGSAMPTNHDHLHPFVEMLKLDIPQSPQIPSVVQNINSYILDNIAYDKVSEHRALHVQLSQNELLLYRDLEEETNAAVYDIIWLTRINNFWNTSASIGESFYYLLPDAKLAAKDMIYDNKNKRINLLGFLSHCVQGLTQLLAQADPYSLVSGLKVGQLGGAFYGNLPCQSLQPPFADLYYNDLDLMNLALNHYNPCFPVLIAGVNGKGSVLTETYDVAASSCDMPLDVHDIAGNPYIKPYPISNDLTNRFFYTNTNTLNTDFVLMHYLCNELDACSHLWGGKSLREIFINRETTREIFIEDNHQFICDGFEGDIHYSVYNMKGKLLQQGITKNGKHNLVKAAKGIYLLKASDAVGCPVVKKFVIL